MPKILAGVLLLIVAQAGFAQSDEATSATQAQRILAAARQEAERRVRYHEEYVTLAYPNGDVPANTGVCTDLVIRAYRAVGVDLQRALHEDRVKNPKAYPVEIWDYKKSDKNIDHRRCQNLVRWFERSTVKLTTSLAPETLKSEWQPGDVVFYVRPGASHPWHIAIVSDRRDADGMPRIIDGYPPHTSERHRLDTFAPIHSHFRLREAGEDGR